MDRYNNGSDIDKPDISFCIEKKYIDSHCHYECGKFSKNRESILEKVHECCEKIICVGTDISTNYSVVELTKGHDFVYGMVGFFPTKVYSLEPEICSKTEYNMNTFLSQLKEKKCVGLGEIGLDYNWDSCGIIKGERAREYQKKWFEKQARIAIDMDIPVSIHSRDAEKDTIEIIKKLDGLTGVMHCFSYGPETARFLVESGLYLGIGGTSTYKSNENIRQAIKETPIENIILETDSPYLSPEPVRKHINDSSNIKYIIKNIADIKGITCNEVIDATNENCRKLYRF